MTEERRIIYEPHPVTPERKAELRKEGYTILDTKFEPNPKPKLPNAEPVGRIGTDSGDQLSDEQLRAAIESVTGKPTHQAMTRENLIAKYNKLNSEQN